MHKEKCPHCGHVGLSPTFVAGRQGFDFSNPATHRHCPSCEATVSTETAARAARLARYAMKRAQAQSRAAARGAMA